PDIVLVDLDLPDMPGFDVGTSIRASDPQTRIVALTAMNDRRLYLEASRLDFDGYVSKYAPIDTFVDALKAAADGDVVFAHLGAHARGGAAEGTLTKTPTHPEPQEPATVTAGLDSSATRRSLHT